MVDTRLARMVTASDPAPATPEQTDAPDPLADVPRDLGGLIR